MATTYTITFNAKGGTGAPGPITFSSGSGAEIPSTEPTKDGYRFMGWDMYSSGDMVYLRPGDTYAADADQTAAHLPRQPAPPRVEKPGQRDQHLWRHRTGAGDGGYRQ